MPFRLIEIILPENKCQDLNDLLRGRKDVLDMRVHSILGTWDMPARGYWESRLSSKQTLTRVLVKAEESQALLDLLAAQFHDSEGFRINIIPVEASIPDFKDKEQTADETAIQETSKPTGMISREELYNDLEEAAKTTNVYMAMIILSSIVAAIGVMTNNVAIIIGAMVMAPLLGPNVALSLATTLGDLTLARNALKTNAIGIVIAAVLSTIIGAIFPINPLISEIASRTHVGLPEVVVALASGCAGALSFTAAIPGVLIGVAVAVSLLPPLVTFGLLLGAGFESLAFGALLLFLVNLICVNLAGVVTFLAQGITPSRWFEIRKAKKATFIAISIWVLLLAALIVIMILFGQLQLPRLSFNSSFIPI